MRVLLDADITIELLKDRAPLVAPLQAIGFGSLSMGAVTKAKLLFGAINKTALAFILKGIAPLLVWPIVPSISESALELMEHYVLSNRLALPCPAP